MSFPRQTSSSSSAGNKGAIARHASTMNGNYLGKNCALHGYVAHVEGCSPTKSTFSADAEDSVAVGTKRTRSLDDSEPEDSYNSISDTGDVYIHADLISTIVARAKRLKMSDSAANDRDIELRHSLVNEHPWEEREPVLRAAASHSVILPETPSLTGLAEELILEILQKLSVTDIMALRRTHKRLASITRARVLWLRQLCHLMDHVQFARSPATLIPSQLSSRAVERAVLRPHIFDYKWLRGIAHHASPITSKVLTTSWTDPEDIRFPILMPGGRWLIAACDDGRSSNTRICLWDLDHGMLKWLPEAQMVAEGRISSLDMKMDHKGSFAFLVVLSARQNAAAPATLVHQLDVCEVVFRTDEEASSFRQIDSLSLGTRRCSEVQIYPQYGRVILDLFDRVLLWDYAPINMCAWMPTSKRRFSHRAAHAITHTQKYLLVADGDESVLRVFPLPPLLDRPADLRDLPLFILPPYLVRGLPSFSISLRFSSERLVDISSKLDTTKRVRFLFESAGRGCLFIDAATCDSYLFCSFPVCDISSDVGSSDTLCFSSREREDAQELACSGSLASGTSRANARPFYVPAQPGGQRDSSRSSANALWVGQLGGISSALTGDNSLPKFGVRDVVLMRNPKCDGSLIILSTMIPASVDLEPGQSRMADIEQGAAKTVLRIPDESAGARARGSVRVEEASVDEVSGKVCIVETTAVLDRITKHPKIRCGLRLLEYA